MDQHSYYKREKMQVQRCKLFGYMLCLLVTARSYDWGGSGLIRAKASSSTHLNNVSVEELVIGRKEGRRE